MNEAITPEAGRTLAEILRLPRWAGGEAVDAARLFGLMHGFETVLRAEECTLISKDAQDHVEDILEEVDRQDGPVDGRVIDDRLRFAGIDRDVAIRVMELCRLQSRFPDAIDRIASARGVPAEYHSLAHTEPGLEAQWFGALHYMELVDCTEGVEKKMHAVFSPCVPRLGEIVEPQKGSLMEVAAVHYAVIRQKDSEGATQAILVPHVYLEAIDEQVDDEESHD